MIECDGTKFMELPMLDLQRMFQQGHPDNTQWQSPQSPITQQQHGGNTFGFGQSMGGYQFGSGLMNLSRWLSPFLSRGFNDWRSQTPNQPQSPADPQQQSPVLAPTYVGDPGSTMNDPFGPSINNGTLGAMLARQPGVY